MCVHAHVCTYIWRPEADVGNHPQSLFYIGTGSLRKTLSLLRCLPVSLASLGSLASGISVIRGRPLCLPAIYIGSEDLNSGPYNCGAST